MILTYLAVFYGLAALVTTTVVTTIFAVAIFGKNFVNGLSLPDTSFKFKAIGMMTYAIAGLVAGIFWPMVLIGSLVTLFGRSKGAEETPPEPEPRETQPSPVIRLHQRALTNLDDGSFAVTYQSGNSWDTHVAHGSTVLVHHDTNMADALRTHEEEVLRLEALGCRVVDGKPSEADSGPAKATSEAPIWWERL